MGRLTKRAPLILDKDQRAKLEQISGSLKAPLREVLRAKVMLLYADRVSISNIKRKVQISRPSIYKCIDKALAAGPEMGLRVCYHRPFDPVIDENAKRWVTNIACTKPTEYGMAAELWTLSALAEYTRINAPKEGYLCLQKAAKATIWRILNEAEIKPNKIKYYLERRDPEFEEKMKELLLVYKEVDLQNASDAEKPLDVITISVDEKPGIQAIQNIAPDLPPVPGRHSCHSRDYEYKRLGTVSLLAAIDLHDGHVTAQVHDRHRSCEFIQLLKELDEKYPLESKLRLILDNHSAHISKETMKYLSTRPGRFIYCHTPKHGSWLNLVETLFSKMARTFLRHIRVQSKEELKSRIMKGIEEINASPVVHRWKNFNLSIAS